MFVNDLVGAVTWNQIYNFISFAREDEMSCQIRFWAYWDNTSDHYSERKNALLSMLAVYLGWGIFNVTKIKIRINLNLRVTCIKGHNVPFEIIKM